MADNATPSSGPTLSYNIPQQIAYNGDSYIELVLRDGDWLAATAAPSAGGATPAPAPLSSALARFRPNIPPRDWTPPDPPDPPSRSTKPVVLDLQVDTPSDGGSVSGPSSGVTVYLRGSARVTSGVDTISHVDVQVGSAAAVRANATVADWSTWDYATSVASSGPLVIVVTAYNSTGGVTKSRQLGVSVTVTADPPQPDTVPPVLTLTIPQPGSTVYVDADGNCTVPVQGSVVDPLTAPTSGIATFTVLVDGRDLGVVPAADGSFTATAGLAGRGTHTVVVKAVDNSGLVSSISVDVQAVDVPAQAPVIQRLLVVERYRLSTYSCGYAVGDALKTVTLAPGEVTSYSVKSYEKTDDTADDTSSILDSTNESAKSDFADTLSAEQSNKTATDESLKWHIDAKASASWGFGSASIDGGVAGASSAAREELAKNVSTSVDKHASDRSSLRKLDIHTSRETKTETDVENATESKISNVNLSCSLNIVFSQLVMQYVTLLHLVDARIAYLRADDVTDPDGTVTRHFTYREVTLSQLDALLEQVAVPARIDDVRDALMTVLTNVFDYQDVQHVMVEERSLMGADGTAVPNGTYLRVPKGLSTSYVDDASGTTLTVPGVVMAVTRNTMRTDSVVADCVRGVGNALDDYNTGLQSAALQSKVLANARQQLALSLITDDKADGAKLYEEIYLPAPATPAPAAAGNGSSPAT